MAVRATHLQSRTDITIGPRIDQTSQAIIDEVYQGCAPGVLECREHDNDPQLAHLRDERGRVHGAWVYIQRRFKDSPNDKWVICHFPNLIGRRFDPHVVHVAKSDQHQWQQDYISRAAQDAEFSAEQEVVVNGTRLDVKIDGAIGPIGFEIQHSFLSRAKVQARTRKANSVGIPLVWVADHTNPDWAFKVAHFEANELPDGRTPRGMWTVTTGPRRIIPVACSPKNADRLARCWKPRTRNWCGGWHATFEPIRGLVVDSIAQQVPAGELVQLDTQLKQGVILVSADHRELWINEFASQVERRHHESEWNKAKPCTYRPELPESIWPLCAQCSGPLYLIRPGRVLCEKCRIDNERACLSDVVQSG